MKTLQFEGVKVALKQDKTGYVLTLSMHPDDIPEELLRDFVGSRYQVVMVRLNGNEEPMDRQEEYQGDRAVRIAGILCKDPKFWKYLYSEEQIFDEDMEDATEWVRNYLNVPSRSDLKTNREAQILLDRLHREYQEWTQKN
jgi:transposase